MTNKLNHLDNHVKSEELLSDYQKQLREFTFTESPKIDLSKLKQNFGAENNVSLEINSKPEDSIEKIKQNFLGLQQEFQKSITKLSHLFISHYQQYQDIKLELAKEKQEVEGLVEFNQQ